MLLAMANLQIRVDEKLKNDAQQVANDLGMDLTTAVRVFLKQMVNTQGFPFRPDLDQFYSAKNQKALNASIEQLNNGNVISKTLDELQSMAK
ncbi:type II toxin-antitoxin system RelB/DinJ family antitoxin [Orbaceae bacterium ac157xtp]